jgi:hypothetical protein
MSPAKMLDATVEGYNPTLILREVYSFFDKDYNLLRCPL